MQIDTKISTHKIDTEQLNRFPNDLSCKTDYKQPTVKRVIAVLPRTTERSDQYWLILHYTDEEQDTHIGLDNLPLSNCAIN